MAIGKGRIVKERKGGEGRARGLGLDLDGPIVQGPRVPSYATVPAADNKLISRSWQNPCCGTKQLNHNNAGIAIVN